MVMADFMLFARTMNFDGLSSLWLRNVTSYVFATAGGKIATRKKSKIPAHQKIPINPMWKTFCC